MMYCENCGKKLIRGYQFCMECGTPVPPEQSEDETPAAVEAAPAASEEMPGIKPNSEEGTLVFCPTCGMRMQKSTEYCEKCGMKLGGNSSSVPLVNTEPLGGGDFSGMSDSDIAQINNFVNNSGFDGSSISYDANDYQGADAFGGGNLSSEIEALNQQFANLNATASDMPAISAPVHEPEPEPEPAPAAPEPEPFSRRVEDFSMDAGMPETQFLSESGLPVINGGDMSEPDTPADLEQHLGDINIDAEPVFTAPKPETPAYTEPEQIYTAPEPEAPSYSEPAAEETAPAEETPAYTEPGLSTSPYGSSEPAASFDPPLSTSPYGNDEATVMLSDSEPAAEETAPAEETPAYTEPELSTSPYGNSEPAASFDPPLSTSPYGNDDATVMLSDPEPAAEETAPAEETPAYTEPGLSTSPYGSSEPAASFDPPLSTSPYGNDEATVMLSDPEPAEPIQFNRPAPAPKEEAPSDENADLGKLVYCRNCGQDMYENEPVCKNCGSPNKWNVKPLKKSVSGGNSKPEKEPFKLFGVISVPAIIGAAVVVVGAIVLIVSTAVNKKPSTDIVSSGNSVTFNSNPDTSADNTPATSAPESDVNPIIPATSESSQQEQNPVSEETSAPAQTAEASVPDDNSQPGRNESDTSTPDASKPDTSKPATSRPAATTKPGTTTKPNAVTTKPTATTKPSTPAQTTAKPVTTTPAAVSKPTATVSSEDKQRAKMLDAFEAISAEVGKLHIYSQATLNALEEGKTRTYYTSGMTKTLSNGKSSAASLYKNAEPSSAQFNTAYQSLGKLYDLYTDYYTYVTTSTDAYDTYSSKESTKLGSFNSAVKSGFGYSKLQTENQTSADKSRTYAEIMTDASSAASNAVSKFSSVKTAAEKLKSGAFTDNVMSTIYNDNTSGILSAAGYYQTTIGYYNILSSGAPSEYSSAKSSLSSTANDLENLLSIFTMAGENSLSGFKSDSAAEIKSANSDISAINKAL